MTSCTSQVLTSFVEEAVLSLPLPAVVAISSCLAEDLLVQLLLRLNPLRSFKGPHLDQQQLLTLCVHMSAATLETLSKVPGVSTDEDLRPPSCDAWEAAVLLQCSVMEQFGTSYKVRKLLVSRDPALLTFIPQKITEAVLKAYKDEAEGVWIPPQISSDEESPLFSQFLPDTIKEELFEQYGSWIKRTKVFQKAFLKKSDEDILENQEHQSEPLPFDKEDPVTDSDKEVTPEAEISLMLQEPPICQSEDQEQASSTEEQHPGCGAESLQPPPDQLISAECRTKEPNVQTDKALVQESIIRSVLAKLFKAPNFCTPRSQKSQDIEDEMVEHMYMLLKKEAQKYKKNRVFLKQLQLLEDPKQEAKFSRELRRPVKAQLREALQKNRLSRKDVMEDAQVSLLASRLIATEILNHLRPTVSFAVNTKPGDETPYTVNIPIRREEPEPERELTQLEMRLQEQQAAARVETKSNRLTSWLHRLFRSKI